jgi:hypothetical protein
MNAKNLLEGRTGPITQSVDAVKALLSWKKIASDPLSADVSMDNGRLVLVLSNKKDVYYTTTVRACSCPSSTFRGGRCKHQRHYFPQEQVATAAESSSIRPEGKWPGGLNGPVDSIPGEEKAAKAASLSIIDCHDTSDKDAAYWSIQEDKILWPAEA